MTKTNEKALSAFVGHIGDIAEKLAAIQAHIDDHMNTSPDQINWGHTGSAAKVSEDLDNIMMFLGLKEETEA